MAENYSARLIFIDNTEAIITSQEIRSENFLAYGVWQYGGNNVKELHIGDNCTVINWYETFKSNTSMTCVTYSENCSVSELPQGTNSRMYSITEIVYPPSMKTFNRWCTDCCSSLTSVTITTEADDFSIANNSFTGLTSLLIFTMYSTTPPTDLNLDGANSLEHIYVPKNSVNAYKQAFPSYASYISSIPTPPPPIGSTKHLGTFQDQIPQDVEEPFVAYIIDSDEVVYLGSPTPQDEP